MRTTNTIFDQDSFPASPVDRNLNPTPLVVSPANAAKMCGVSRAQWFKMMSAGKTPAPTYLSVRKPVWLISELKDWLANGAPDRQTWERLKKGGNR